MICWNDNGRALGHLFLKLLLALVLFTHASSATAQAVPGWLRGLLPGQQTAPQANPLAALNLTEEQLAALSELARKQAIVQTQTAQKVAALQSRLPALYAADRLDETAIGDAFTSLFELQRNAILQGVRTYNLQLDLLSDEQRILWRKMRQQTRPPGS